MTDILVNQLSMKRNMLFEMHTVTVAGNNEIVLLQELAIFSATTFVWQWARDNFVY